MVSANPWKVNETTRNSEDRYQKPGMIVKQSMIAIAVKKHDTVNYNKFEDFENTTTTTTNNNNGNSSSSNNKSKKSFMFYTEGRDISPIQCTAVSQVPFK